MDFKDYWHKDSVKTAGFFVVGFTVLGMALSLSGSLSSASGSSGGDFWSMGNNLLWGTMIGFEVAFFGMIAYVAPDKD